MKYSAVALAAFVALASAQSLSDIPECAVPCIEDATKKSSKCAITDYACICKNQNDIVPAATNCVLSECGNAVALNQVLPATEKFCKEVEAGGSGDAPASSAAPESSAPAASSSAPPAASSSPAPEPSSAAPSTTLSSSVVPSAEPSSTTTASATGTSSPPVITAGAAHVAGSLGLVVLGAVAAL